MSAEAPQSLQRAGLRRAVHARPEAARVAVPGSVIFRHFAPELKARFLRERETVREEGS